MVIKGQQQQEFLVDNFHKIRYDGKNSPTILFEKESNQTYKYYMIPACAVYVESSIMKLEVFGMCVRISQR